MSRAKTIPVYHGLVIMATCPETEIWLGDDRGHFVEKGAETHPADAAERCGGVMLGVRQMGNESRR